MVSKRDQFRAICQSHGVGLAYAFGSAADRLMSILADATPEPLDPLADLDLGVVFAIPLPQHSAPAHEIYARLHSDLGELFSPMPLDLVLLEETHSLLQVEAISGLCAFEVSSDFRQDFELNALRRAADFRYHFEQYHRERREALR